MARHRREPDDEPAEPASTADRRLGEIVKVQRLARQWSQERLAGEMSERGFGWYQSTVNRIENGQRPISYNEAVELAAVLDFSLAAVAATDEQRVRDKIARVERELEQANERVMALVRERGELEGQLAALADPERHEAMLEAIRRDPDAWNRTLAETKERVDRELQNDPRMPRTTRRMPKARKKAH